MESDGSRQRQLTFDLGSLNFGLSISPDGRYIVFVSGRGGTPHIWRVGVDGSNPKQLTDGGGEFNPSFLPDSQWVKYITFPSGKKTFWKIPVEGGKPVEISGPYSEMLGVSPDGKLIAYIPQGEQEKGKRVGIVSSEGDEPTKILNLPPAAMPRRLQWTPDASALSYIVTRAGVSNIWSLPIAGGQPIQLTDFKSQFINCFAWSRDGQQLAMSRGTQKSDVVMIKSFR